MQTHFTPMGKYNYAGTVTLDVLSRISQGVRRRISLHVTLNEVLANPREAKVQDRGVKTI